MKRIIALTVILSLFVTLTFASCGGESIENNPEGILTSQRWLQTEDKEQFIEFNEDKTGKCNNPSYWEISDWSILDGVVSVHAKDGEYSLDEKYKLEQMDYDGTSIITLTNEDDERDIFVRENDYETAKDKIKLPEKIAGKAIINGTETTLDALKDEFENNESAAKDKYLEQDIIVYDEIDEIHGEAILDSHSVDGYIETKNGCRVETSGIDMSSYNTGDMVIIKGNLYYYFAWTFEIYQVNGHSVSISPYEG